MMNILLITNYFSKDKNHTGAIRWGHFVKYLKCDILTLKHQKGIYDESFNKFFKDTNLENNIYRVGFNISLPACFSFLFFITIFFFNKRLQKYDCYIISSPPETLIFFAYLLQKMGKKVVLDMRDVLDVKQRTKNKYKTWVLTPLFKYFYRRIKNRVVCMQFIDKDATCIHSGHDELKLNSYINEPYFYPYIRMKYLHYIDRLEDGGIPYKKRNWGLSFMNLKHLWGDRLKEFYPNLHQEIIDMKVHSWEYQAKKLKKYLKQ